ncbi:MAG: metallophosphoesterase [Deltaproteobacteria bacterium RBG_16_54_18]|jgi:metallophosphoesterase (TIGR00282 family)|nr:MAG: metallophosphoesterase [Deltaproteobacteria bacterium RBG_16_54_18]
MRILFIGDVVGKGGRRAITDLLPTVIKEGVDFVIANGENVSGGIGITPQYAQMLWNQGVNVITTGNHIWRKKEILSLLDHEPCLLRPANYPLGTPGRGSGTYATAQGQKVGVINLEGRVFMRSLESPFKTAEEHIALLRRETKVIIVDFHAEATSEKVALGWFLDGEVSAVLGTHTHVQTADEKVLPGGTAYITDVGMTGPSESVIGIRKEIAVERFLTLLPNKFEPATGKIELQGAIVDVDEETGRSREIRRVKVGAD